ncbi:arylesterase [Lyophyllum atratum]|nr:arylesterase [Lyophyllum atratum]
MVSTRTLAYLAGFISIVVWRSGRVAKNSILTKHAFPEGYYAQGDFDTDCATLKGGPDLKYCEDATFWDLLDAKGKFVDRGLLLSCDAGRKSWNTVMGPLRNPQPHGSLWLYEPDGKGKKGKAVRNPSKLKRLELAGFPAGHDFHPLGVEIYPSYAGNTSNLYVVNHARARTVIEQFTLSPSSPTVAKYVRTLASPYFHSANALALTSPDSFYVTNDHLFTRRLPYLGHILPILESVFALPLSFVSHVTLSPPSSSQPPIETHQFSALFIPFPNGIALSPDGTQVALASTTLGTILIYSRNPATNELTRIDNVPVPFTPDNIRYTHDGTALLVAGHPHFPTLTAVAANKTLAAPSWVVSIDMRASKSGAQPKQDFDRQAPTSAKGKVPPVAGREITTIFQSDGSGFSSSSTGLQDPVTGALYVTGLYAEEGVIVCHPST